MSYNYEIKNRILFHFIRRPVIFFSPFFSTISLPPSKAYFVFEYSLAFIITIKTIKSGDGTVMNGKITKRKKVEK